MVNFNSVPQIIPRLIEQYHLEKTFKYKEKKKKGYKDDT